ELAYRSKYLAGGYNNQPEKTLEVFVEDPPGSGQCVYKSGDLGRRLPDGRLEYLGRRDFQVKIRGYRIELSEIEAQLQKYDLVKEAVVVNKENAKNNRYLCAYVVSDEKLEISVLRKSLAKELPEYMVPSYIVQIEKIPLTPNGKIDREALPEPAANINTGTEYQAPTNRAEEVLAGIWQEVLDVERVGINDDFFELGGNSLSAIKMIAKSGEYGLSISLSQVFKYRTIAELFSNIDSKSIGLADAQNGKDLGFSDDCNNYKDKPGYRKHNRDFEVNVQYPYYYPCILGVVMEKIKYEHDFKIDASFLPVAQGINLIGYIHFDEYPDRIQYMDNFYSSVLGDAAFDFNSLVELKLKWFEHFEDGVEYCTEHLANNELVIVGGTTYYLKYSHDYLIGEEEWARRINSNEQNLIRSDPEEMGLAHTFLLVDITEKGYIVYDTSFNYFGEISKDDFKKAFAGLKYMECLNGSKAQKTNLPHQIFEVEVKSSELDIKKIGLEILRQCIYGYTTDKREHTNMYLPGGIPTPVTISIGVEALIEIAYMLEGVKQKNECERRFADLKVFLGGIFGQWKARYALFLDFLRDLSKYHHLPDGILEGFEEVVQAYSTLDMQAGLLEKDSIVQFVEIAIEQLYTTCERQKMLFSALDKSINKFCSDS
ncbi:MAG: AMP-binding protein, partial [Clostridia bacterium]|nr:AMP-binding protein [Clostridia bacterium]